MLGESVPSTNNQEQIRLAKALRESELLREIAELLASSLDLSRTLQVLVQRTAEICAVERCAVWLFDESKQLFTPAAYHLSTDKHKLLQRANHVWHQSSLSVDFPLIQRLLHEQPFLIIDDLHIEAHIPKVTDKLFVRSVLLIALLRQGRPVGLMSLDNMGQLTTFTTEQQQMARAISQQATVAIDNARLYQEAQQERTRQSQLERRIRHALNTMLYAAKAVSGLDDTTEILRQVLVMTLSTLHCEQGAVQLFDEEQHTFTPLLAQGLALEELDNWLTDFKHPSTQNKPPTRKAMIKQLRDGRAQLLYNKRRDSTLLATPITHNKRLLGVMLILQHTIEFNAWDLAVAEGIAQFAGLAIEQTHWRQEAEIARLNEATMRESNELKDEFLAITAHEFRTPLTVILAHSQMMARLLKRATDIAPELKDRLHESLFFIEDQTRQLTNIVNTFLEVTRLNRGQIHLSHEQLLLDDIIKELVSNHSATSAIHTITTTIAPHTHPYTIMGDKARLQQIFANLLQNAIKYSPNGGPISLQLTQIENPKGQHIIQAIISDRGIGIPKEAQAHLFERFYRAPNVETSRARGVGLGLYVVSEFLHLHGGTITVESSGIEGEGSKFILTLPHTCSPSH